MSNVKLLPHNQITFDYILDFARNNMKICIPQATGTGKTYLEARILEHWNDRNAIIFAPSNEILRDTEKLLSKHNIYNYTTITYQTLNNMSEEEISNIEVEIVLFDEAHRLLAKEWYKKVQILIESHPYSLIFGLTATPIRSDGRDIREEIFENCSTHYITLAEAIVRDIVKMPAYVSALYTFDKMVNDLQQKIDNGKNSMEEKNELKKKLSAAKKNLELSVGVPSIIKKYISDYNGKYIVFCRDTDHLEEAVCLVNNWFKEAGYEENINNYKIGVNYNDSDKQLEEFRNSDKVELHLLFAIEKLNEGIHIPSVDGVILLRPTSSNIIYYQQIGRCITANSDKTPIVLDLVDNVNGVKVVLKDDIEKCVDIRMDGGYTECSTDFNVEKYYIDDYLHREETIFKNIENNIFLNCKMWTQEEDKILEEYYISDGIKLCLEKLPHRTIEALKSRASALGLSRVNKWSDEEIKKLIKVYPNSSIEELLKIFHNRTKYSIKSKAHELNLHSNKMWSDQEIMFLKKNIDKYNTAYVANVLNRPIEVVRKKIRDLNLPRGNAWTEEEIKILYDKYPTIGIKCMDYLPNRSKESIYSYAKRHNIKFKDK